MRVARDGQPAGLLAIADPIKASAAAALAALQADGVHVVMLTGDSRTTAESVARRLGLADVVAELLPDQKADRVAALQADGRRGAMAGGGLHAPPAPGPGHCALA